MRIFFNINDHLNYINNLYSMRIKIVKTLKN